MAQTEATLLLAIKTAGESVLSKTGDALASLGKIAVAAYAAANAAAAASIHAYREQEVATNALNQALVTQGIYSKSLSDSYQKMASELQKVTTYGDEQIVSAQAQLQKYLGQTKITKELTSATLDFATAMHMDLDSAAIAVGKSIGTSTNALGRYGIQIDASVPKSVKMEEVLHGLNKTFGGQAKAAADGLGALDQMKNALGDVLEAAGEKLAPVVSSLAKDITKFADEVSKNEMFLQNMNEAAKGLAYTAIFLKNMVMAAAETIGQVFGTLIGAAMQAAKGDFKLAMESMKNGFSSTADSLEKRYQTYHDELSTVDRAFNEQKKNEEKKELELLKQSNANKIRLQSDLFLTQEQMFAFRDEKEIRKLQYQAEHKKEIEEKGWNQIIYGEGNVTKKLEAENAKRKYLEDEYQDYARLKMENGRQYESMLQDKKVQQFESVLNSMEAMQNSRNKVLVAIGKAAAIAHITINTAKAVMGAYAWGAENVGIAAGVALAAPIAGYGLDQATRVAGVELAEGGIVKASPGGTLATIGEGGRDEMVIPLDKAGRLPGSGGVQLTVYGGFLGSESHAKEFALALDKELLKLRQSNQSLAFDKGVI